MLCGGGSFGVCLLIHHKMATRKGFTFYPSWHEAISELSDQDQLEMYQAICHYQLAGIEPQFKSRECKLVWLGIQYTLKQSLEGFEAKTGEKITPPEHISTPLTNPSIPPLPRGVNNPSQQEKEKEEEEISIKEKIKIKEEEQEKGGVEIKDLRGNATIKWDSDDLELNALYKISKRQYEEMPCDCEVSVFASGKEDVTVKLIDKPLPF